MDEVSLSSFYEKRSINPHLKHCTYFIHRAIHSSNFKIYSLHVWEIFKFVSHEIVINIVFIALFWELCGR